MVKFWKKEDELTNSPQETMGFTKDFQTLTKIQNYLIKMYKLTSKEQVTEIKSLLSQNNVLIINAKELLDNHHITIEELRETMDQIKMHLAEFGGSIGRIGGQYLILTPNVHIRISN
ncbi:MAG: cell division protein SepF [Promethearchaeota archaeon]